LITSNDHHKAKIQRSEALKAETNKIKKLAKQELSKLESLYEEEVKLETEDQSVMAKL